MTQSIEFRCVECGWLDPRLWSCYSQCACNHYFRNPELDDLTKQLNIYQSFRRYWRETDVGER